MRYSVKADRLLSSAEGLLDWLRNFSEHLSWDRWFYLDEGFF